MTPTAARRLIQWAQDQRAARPSRALIRALYSLAVLLCLAAAWAMWRVGVSC